MSEDIVAMARAAEKDERLSDGALYGKLAARIEQLEAERDQAISAVRRWHTTALVMRDMSITGKGNIQDCYFDAAMSIPFYGAADDQQSACTKEK